MKYEAICIYSPEHSVRKMCEVLGLRECGYYQWLRRLEKNRVKREEERILAKRISEVFIENKEIYGYRKMQRELIKTAIYLSEYRVRKIMKETGLYPVILKKYKPTHNGKNDGRFYSNIIKQNFTAKEPNNVWSGDITYIKTNQGYVYLATIIDLYNREVVGYSISKNIDSDLAKKALGNALIRVNTKESKIIFHSDRGCQYSSKAYQHMLNEYGIRGSMSRPGCPYDNACSESFFSSAKRECIYRKNYLTIEEVKRDLFEYIELFYNRKRMHASLGYMSPVEYRLSNMYEKAS